MIKTPYDLIPYTGILAIFFLGTWYHMRIYRSCIYHTKLTKSMKVVLFFIPILFIGMAYFVGEKSLYKYPLSLMASLFLMSGPLAEGISEKGFIIDH